MIFLKSFNLDDTLKSIFFTEVFTKKYIYQKEKKKKRVKMNEEHETCYNILLTDLCVTKESRYTYTRIFIKLT